MLPTRIAASRLVLASLSVASLVACGMEPFEAAPSERLARAAAALTSAVPISPERELVITHRSVIASALETTFDPASPSGTSARGAWSFGRLVHNMLPPGKRDSAAAASALVMSWLRTWESEQLMNGEVSAARARPAIRLLVTDRWKAASGCSDPASPATDASCVLDMTKAPFKLLAILYRPDLRVVASDGTAIGGEGRFVFQVVGPTLAVSAVARQVEIMDPTLRPQKFTVIVEYSLPVARNSEILTRWAYRWHALGAIPFGETYNAALLGITNDFAGPDRDRRRPNGNALNQLRTNEVALAGARFVEPDSGFVAARQVWELRESG